MQERLIEEQPHSNLQQEISQQPILIPNRSRIKRTAFAFELQNGLELMQNSVLILKKVAKKIGLKK